ncbi:GIY-YIG nuclease family protein [Hyphococcus sp.]|uniref:GIY-YIG nuclease family protein n=1 Tax=Hyphococcus sp. TaxID=2038636 RepID=UPI0035C70178
MKDRYYVYIMTNKRNTVLYVGVTGDLGERVTAHISGAGSDFTSKYKISKLVYYEAFAQIEEAIAREKRLKRWRRSWKNELIERSNPNWDELTAW